MAILVVADHHNSGLKDATLNAITAASELAAKSGDAEVHVLVAGAACEGAASAAAAIEGVDKILSADDAAFAHPLAEGLASLVVGLADGYGAILTAATTTGKNFMPRVAALLDVMQISEVISIVAGDTFKRPIYAGNAIQTVKSHDAIKILTVRTTAFSPAASGGSAEVENIEAENIATGDNPGISAFVSADLSKSDRPELTSAKIIISGGRGMASGDNFALIDTIADKLGAAVGASRAAVDAGYVPNDYQVGQTGKIVAPDLYIAVGISGAIQHLAGMKDSKIIVAINKDEDAPIFQVADYGLVADLFDVLPELDKAL
jgi:electron transfer flavoprotein alpha subunit